MSEAVVISRVEFDLWTDSPLYNLMCEVVNGERSDWPTGYGEPSHQDYMLDTCSTCNGDGDCGHPEHSTCCICEVRQAYADQHSGTGDDSMIPAIYNWHACRVCGLPVPAGETAHRECSERVRTDEPGALAAHLADAGDVEASEFLQQVAATDDYLAEQELAEQMRGFIRLARALLASEPHTTAAQEARGDE